MFYCLVMAALISMHELKSTSCSLYYLQCLRCSDSHGPMVVREVSSTLARVFVAWTLHNRIVDIRGGRQYGRSIMHEADHAGARGQQPRLILAGCMRPQPWHLLFACWRSWRPLHHCIRWQAGGNSNNGEVELRSLCAWVS
jgi:hypothetical protein